MHILPISYKISKADLIIFHQNFGGLPKSRECGMIKRKTVRRGFAYGKGKNCKFDDI